MSTQSCNCFTEAAVWGRTRNCGCPDDEFKPWDKFQKLCAANLDFSDQREEVESSNTRGQNACSFTVNSGATYAPSTDLDFGAQEAFWQGAFGALERPIAEVNAGLTTTTNSLCSTSVRFEDLGFRAGQVVALEGFAQAQNNSDPASHGGDYPHYYLVQAISFDDATGTSCLSLAVGSLTDKWVPELAAGDSGGRVFTLARAWQSSDRLAYADFQKVIIGSDGQPVYQALRGALLAETSLNWTPNGFATADFTAEGAKFDLVLNDFSGIPAAQSEDCQSCCDTLQWDAAKEHVQVYIGDQRICVTEAALNVNRNPSREVTSCGAKISSGKFEVEGTITALFGEGLYPAQFLEYLRDNQDFMVHKRWWNPDFTRFAYITIPVARLTANQLTTTDGECAKQAMTYRAQSGCSGALVLGGATYTSEVQTINAVSYSTQAASTSVLIGGAAGDVFHDVTGDDVSDATSTGGFAHTYNDGILNHDGTDFDLEAAPWTAYARANSGLTCIDICNLKAAEAIDLSGNALGFVDASGLPALLSLDLSGNADLSCVDVSGSFVLETLNLDGTSLSMPCIEALMRDLIDHGTVDGTLTLPAGFDLSATAINRRAMLVDRGWTVG